MAVSESVKKHNANNRENR